MQDSPLIRLRRLAATLLGNRLVPPILTSTRLTTLLALVFAQTGAVLRLQNHRVVAKLSGGNFQEHPERPSESQQRKHRNVNSLRGLLRMPPVKRVIRPIMHVLEEEEITRTRNAIPANTRRHQPRAGMRVCKGHEGYEEVTGQVHTFLSHHLVSRMDVTVHLEHTLNGIKMNQEEIREMP